MKVQNCTFKRTEQGPTEQGVMLDNGTEALIVDLDCKPVDAPIWTYQLREDYVMTIPKLRGRSDFALLSDAIMGKKG